jgi:haloalkane dehalogenase
MPYPLIRTPAPQFDNLVGYPFTPNYQQVMGYRIHYVDEGDSSYPAIFLLHGEPSWSYLYRKMIPPLVDAGYRVIAPDLLGFGKSDKLLHRKHYSYQLMVDLFTEFVKKLDTQFAAIFIQDWGSLIGLRLLETVGDRIDRVVLSNGALPSATGLQGLMGHFLFKLQIKMKGRISQEDLQAHPSFINWVTYSQTAEEFPIGDIVQGATITELSEAELSAYNAPFPDDRYKAGARQLPILVTSQLRKNYQVTQDVIYQWEKPFLTAFGDSDPITRGNEASFIRKVPGAQGLDHRILEGGAHFIQEDKPDELVDMILDLIAST